MVDFRLSAETHAAENGKRRAPTLHRVLQKESPNQRWKHEPFSIDGRPKRQSDNDGGRGVRFECPLDVPLAIQL